MTLNQIVDMLLTLADKGPEEAKEKWYDLIFIATRYYELREGESLEGYPLTVQLIDELPWAPPTVIEEMYEDDLNHYHTWITLLRHMLRFVKEDNGFGFNAPFLSEFFAPLLSSTSIASALDETGGHMEEAALHLLEPFKLSKAFDTDLINDPTVIWSL